MPQKSVALPRIVITTGDPAGIGPEIAVRLLASLRQQAPNRAADCQLILIGDATLLKAQAAAFAPELRLHVSAPFEVPQSKLGNEVVLLWHTPVHTVMRPGVLDPRNAAYVLKTLDIAIAACSQGYADAMVTCPIAKSVINDAAIENLGFFQGHTEYLAKKTATPQVVMLLAGRTYQGTMLRVALATTHLPLKEVSAALTCVGLAQTLQILHTDLREKFGIATPCIGVCGLNPHAGESGHLGTEEIEVIAPVIKSLQAAGMDVRGPYPADTIFAPHRLKNLDCVLAIFHDQGLPVLKYATFGNGINVTLGLPLIRTSVDHGVALDLAGKGLADIGSLREALFVAIEMVQARVPRVVLEK
jgi:4-hydroxythreonine-4-phosphate dehydrogenase